MSTDHAGSLSELELDTLWTVYEGHSLVIERPEGDAEHHAHVIMSIAYDEADEAVAEVAEIPLETVEDLIARGFLERSEDGPVLDADNWFDEELGLNVHAEEYLLSPLGQRIIDDTAAPEVVASDNGEFEDDDLEDDEDDLDDDEDEEDEDEDVADDEDEDDDLWDDEDEDGLDEDDEEEED